MITYVQALILGLVQGVTELFPISSLGHSVLIADLFNWKTVLSGESGANSGSTLLLFLIVLHVATALALIVFYRREWLRIVAGFFGSLKSRNLSHPDAKLAWLLIIATIPAGLIAFIFQNLLRTQFAKPLSAIIFIIINGLLLLSGDRYIRQHGNRRQRGRNALSDTASRTSDTLTLPRAALIGVAQIGALIAGISRSGITMIGGIYSGLNHEDSARFSFLLATPIILAAGIYKLPDVLSSKTASLHGQMLVGGLAAAIAAYFSVRYLDSYFRNKRLKPFGIYCISVGVFMLLLGVLRGHF
jgi:undecaprenyl-diphosphatase